MKKLDLYDQTKLPYISAEFQSLKSWYTNKLDDPKGYLIYIPKSEFCPLIWNTVPKPTRNLILKKWAFLETEIAHFIDAKQTEFYQFLTENNLEYSMGSIDKEITS